MVGFLIVIGVGVIVLALLAIIALAGFTNGDHTGEALARVLRADLEAAATRWDRGAGRS